MHNFDLWQCYMKNIKSPQSFIDMGFYTMISAALQRRIWIGPIEKPLFPNLYTVLVGGPGIGKNLVIEQVSKFLKYHKLRTKPISAPQILTKEAKQLLEIKQQLEDSMEQKFKKESTPLLFPVAPDDITYEALLQCQANSMRRINVDTCSMAPSGTYGHSSLIVLLNEMTTLFKRTSEKTLRYLISAYDCGDYDYMTKHQGTDRIRRICLNILAGITPGDLKELVTSKVIHSGWSGRNIFVYEESNRFNLFTIPLLDEDQKDAEAKILNHLNLLSKIFGRIEYSKEALEFFEGHFQNRDDIEVKEELVPYFARKNIHAPKLAMAIHFSSLEIIEREGKYIFDNILSLNDSVSAMNILGKLEIHMHKALNFKKINPIAEASEKLMEFIETNGPQTYNSILIKLWNDLELGEDTLNKALAYLTRTGKLESQTFRKDGNNIRIYSKI